jgi:prevent-host-death family protein
MNDQQTISSSMIRENLSEYLNQVTYNKTDFLVQKRNRTVAVLIPVEKYELLEQLEDLVDVRLALKAMKEEEVPFEEVLAGLKKKKK